MPEEKKTKLGRNKPPAISFAVLSKVPREETVEVFVNESDLDGPTVRVRFREIPDAEFELLEGEYRARIKNLERELRDIEEEQQRLEKELPRAERPQALATVQDEGRAPVALATALVRETARKIVARCVVGHEEEDFCVGPIPAVATEEERWNIQASLLAIGLSSAMAYDASQFVGESYPVPFVGARWTYGEGSKARELPGCSEETINFYQRAYPGSTLLASIANSALFWHRLALKTPEQQRVASREWRLARRGQQRRIDALKNAGFLSDDSAEELGNLSSTAFEAVMRVLAGLSKTVSINVKLDPVEPDPLKG